MRRYYNDVWIYNINTAAWASIKGGPASGPSPRGGSQVAVHQDTLYVFWGHSVLIDPSDKSELEKVHGDVWALDFNTSQAGAAWVLLCSPLWRPCVCGKDVNVFVHEVFVRGCWMRVDGSSTCLSRCMVNLRWCSLNRPYPAAAHMHAAKLSTSLCSDIASISFRQHQRTHSSELSSTASRQFCCGQGKTQLEERRRATD